MCVCGSIRKLVSRVFPCCITYDICAPLSSEHYTTLNDSTVAMVIDILMLINEPPEKLRDPTLEKHHYSYSIYGHFFRCTVVQDRVRTYRI